MVATFGPASPENMIRISPEKPHVFPPDTLRLGQTFRVVVTNSWEGEGHAVVIDILPPEDD